MNKQDNTTEFIEESVAEENKATEEVFETVTDETTDATTDEKATTPHPRTNKTHDAHLWWLKYLITAVVLAVFVLLIAWARGGFSNAERKTMLGYWCDAFAVPGILAVCFGLLVVASNGGAFDMLSYAIKGLFRLFKKDPIDRKYGGFYEYTQAKKEKKRSFWYLIVVGGVYLVVGIALFIAYSQM